VKKQERIDLTIERREVAKLAMLSRDLNLFERIMLGEKTTRVASDYGLTNSGLSNAILRLAKRMIYQRYWGEATPDRFYPGLTKPITSTPDEFRKLELVHECANTINYIPLTRVSELLQYPEFWLGQIRRIRWTYRIPSTIQ
jgi:hypothetical protein